MRRRSKPAGSQRGGEAEAQLQRAAARVIGGEAGKAEQEAEAG
jgi:hypothetical protein